MPKSYSQNGQDLNVISKYNNKRDGYFVEVGAYDGIGLSNTYLLEQEYGWKGICVEPIPKNYTKLVQNRPSSICSDKAVYKHSNIPVLFDIGSEEHDTIMLSGISSELGTHRVSIDKDKTTIEVDTITLTDLLDSCKAPKHIDYLSLDTEGSEYEILNAFDFTKYIFGLIDVEVNGEEPKRTKIRELLTANEYVLYSSSAEDDSYYHKSLQQK